MTKYEKTIEILKKKSQEQKTGHWKWVAYDFDNPELGYWECSVCNKTIMTPSFKTFNVYGRNHYCPNCGAKMVINSDGINIKIDAAIKIWAIAGISPEYGNAVMDIIGEEAYQNVMRLQSEENKESEEC